MQTSQTVEGLPRRAVVQDWTPEEKKIFNLIQDIELLGASVKLTKCTTLLMEARQALADHIEGIE